MYQLQECANHFYQLSNFTAWKVLVHITQLKGAYKSTAFFLLVHLPIYKAVREPERLYSGMENPALRGSYVTILQPVGKDKSLSLRGGNVSKIYVPGFSMKPSSWPICCVNSGASLIMSSKALLRRERTLRTGAVWNKVDKMLNVWYLCVVFFLSADAGGSKQTH